MRPKIIVGQLYYLKQHDVFVPAYKGPPDTECSFYECREYIVEALTAEPHQFNEKITICKLFILASTKEADSNDLQHVGVTPLNTKADKNSWGYLRVVHLEGSVRKDRVVIQKLNRKRLPLYVDWAFGKEFVHKLLQEAA